LTFAAEADDRTFSLQRHQESKQADMNDRISTPVSAAGMTIPAWPFWKHKTLGEMTREEWESLCDGCAKCCLAKLQDIESDEIAFTNVACRLLDLKTCRCTNYAGRRRHVPTCERLTPDNVPTFDWLPSSCAYRLIAAGTDLPWWHHLVSGDPDLVHICGRSVRGKVISEAEAGPLEHHLVEWPR
jgi:uncharacterized cysteine cluster protein YcgN (CxxCxxCC family)